jgi:hypothetical protein
MGTQAWLRFSREPVASGLPEMAIPIHLLHNQSGKLRRTTHSAGLQPIYCALLAQVPNFSNASAIAAIRAQALADVVKAH